MKQKIIRKVFAFLALFAIVASLIWVWLVYILSPKQPIKVVEQKNPEINIGDIKTQIIDKNGNNIEVKVDTQKEEKKQK
jgi:hypothetical protein